MEQKASGWWHENVAVALFVSRNIILNHVRGKWKCDSLENTHGEAKGLKFVYFSFEKWLTSVNLRLFVGIVWLDGRLKIELLVFSHLWWCWLQCISESRPLLKSRKMFQVTLDAHGSKFNDKYRLGAQNKEPPGSQTFCKSNIKG